MLGSFVLSSGYYDAYYLKALRTKALIKKAFDEAFAKYDVIIGPAAPTTAPKLGDSLSDPIKMYLGDIYTISVNLSRSSGNLGSLRSWIVRDFQLECRLSETALRKII
ncbi:MAG: amidase family protein [Anaerobutyricum soehngenii]